MQSPIACRKKSFWVRDFRTSNSVRRAGFDSVHLATSGGTPEGSLMQLRERLRQVAQSQGTSISQKVIEIRKDAAESKDKPRARLKQPEAAFLNTWVAPAIHTALTSQGLSENVARELLLAEELHGAEEICELPGGSTSGVSVREEDGSRCSGDP